MTYDEALSYLYGRLPMFQRVGAAALKYDLSNTVKLLESIGNPHQGLKLIHIAGTNGKGSSAHAIASILSAASYKTGLFTSPHLKNFTERARIDGTEMSQEFVAEFVSENRQQLEEINASFFEVTFAMAMSYFQHQKVDYAVIETGLGGRLDSTNVIDPKVCLITMIGMDHSDLLGNTLEQIASEKAGIIKAKLPVVVGADQPDLLHIFQSQAAKLGSELVLTDTEIKPKPREEGVTIDVLKTGKPFLPDLNLGIAAAYFQKNLPGVFKVIDLLIEQGAKIPKESVRTGLEKIPKLSGLKGRWHVLEENPMIVADISHNKPGLEALFEQVETISFDQLHLIIGLVQDKDIKQILGIIGNLAAKFYFTQSSVPRSMSAKDLAAQAMQFQIKGSVYENVNLAIESAKKQAGENDLILICGSTFVVAEIEGL